MTRAEIESFQRTSGTAMVAARSKVMFAALDADKNGQISPAEFDKLQAPPKVDATGVLAVDTNKDGKVSLAEHRTAAVATFNQLDGNKDGILTDAEVKTATAAMKR